MRYLLLRLKRFCGFITGFVFFIGGILKLMDPVGAGLVMEGYLDFLHLGFLKPIAKSAGVFFALSESVIGIGLITGVWRKIFGLLAIAIQGLFTILTLLLVIFNPEMDCGCFGEAIELTHGQTFIKNIILCALLATYYFPAKQLGHNKKNKYVSFGIVTASTVAFAIYSLIYIPLIDFTDYKPAAALQSGHAFASSEDMYESVFIYEKDGQEDTFLLDALPDTTWNFVRTETRVKEGDVNQNIIALSFYDKEDNSMDHIAADGKVMIVSVYNPDMSRRKWAKTAAFMSEASAIGFKTILLTTAIPQDTAGINQIYLSDYKTLITLNRSNGGVTLFSDGYLIRKWARQSVPDKETLSELYYGDDTENIIEQNTHGSLLFQGFLLYVSAVMLLI